MRMRIRYIIFLITGILYFAFLGNIDLWNPDEPRYVEVAREMISLKQYLIPHLNSHIYPDKPPLFFWAIAFMFKIFHSYSEWVARLVPSISGFLIVILTFYYVKKVFKDEKIALLSAIVLSTNVSMVHLSRRCNIDTFFTLFILIAIIFLHNYVNTRKKSNLYISMIFQGIATVIKGPLGFIIPFFTFFGYIFFTKEKKLLKSTPWLISFLILLCVVSLWLVPSWIYGGDEYIKQIILKHVLKRYAEGVSHPRSLFYYFYIFPLDFMPWALFIPVALKYGIYNREKPVDKKLIWFLCWFFINFIFLCFSKEKRGLYLLPLYPAISIIIGYSLAKFDFTKNKLFEYPYIFIIIFLGIGALSIEIFYFIKSGKIDPTLTVSTAIIFWITIAIFLLKNKLNFSLKIFSLYFISAIMFFSVYSYIFPLFNNIKSPKEFLKSLSKHNIKNINNVLFFGYLHPGFNFYLKKDKLNFCKNFRGLEYIWIKKRKIKFVILKKKEYKRYKKILQKILKNYSLIFERQLGHRRLLVFKANLK